jgi:hypothetical protein
MPQPKRPNTKSAPAKTTKAPPTSRADAPVTFLECIPRYLAADLTQRAAVEKKTIVEVVEDALRAYLGTSGAKPKTTPPQVKGEISFGNLGSPTLPDWGGGPKGRRKS